jgi:hypothetical protein
VDRRRFTKGTLALATALAICVPALAAADTSSAVRTAAGLSAKNDDVFPATVVEGGRELGRTRVVWSAAKESGRKASYAVTYSFGAQVQGVKAPPTIRALYYDRATGTNLLTALGFIRQMAGTAVAATETERFYHVSTNPDLYPLFAGERLPFDAAAPVIVGDGVSDALLASMYYDPSVYSIVGSRWDGSMVATDKQYGRWAVYTLRRKTTSVNAIYGGSVALPDVRVYDGKAYYSADASAVAAAKADTSTITSFTPSSHHSPRPTPNPWPIWPLVAAAATATAGAGLVAFWYRRRKRRAVEQGDGAEETLIEAGESDDEGEIGDD